MSLSPPSWLSVSLSSPLPWLVPAQRSVRGPLASWGSHGGRREREGT